MNRFSKFSAGLQIRLLCLFLLFAVWARPASAQEPNQSLTRSQFPAQHSTNVNEEIPIFDLFSGGAARAVAKTPKAGKPSAAESDPASVQTQFRVERLSLIG